MAGNYDPNQAMRNAIYANQRALPEWLDPNGASASPAPEQPGLPYKPGQVGKAGIYTGQINNNPFPELNSGPPLVPPAPTGSIGAGLMSPDQLVGRHLATMGMNAGQHVGTHYEGAGYDMPNLPYAPPGSGLTPGGPMPPPISGDNRRTRLPPPPPIPDESPRGDYWGGKYPTARSGPPPVYGPARPTTVSGGRSVA
jgi:hypothetical protein